jgi:alpha-beta hydrolase superfamily lysophospholipase
MRDARDVMHMILKVSIFGLAGYLAFISLIFIFQRKLLYFPYQAQFTEESAIREGLHHWPSFQDFRGFVGQNELMDTKGTVIVFHGNAGAAFHRSFYVKALSRQKMRVILAEYPGYGSRDARPSESVLVDDALETIRLAYKVYGEPLYVWGESLGCGVVSGAVKETDIPVKGIVLLLPWDTLPNLAQTHYWYFPTRWLVIDKYDNITNLQGFEGNIAFLLAENDEVVPVQHGQRLYDSITTNKKLWLFKDTRHNEFPIDPEQKWWAEVVDFVLQNN